MPGHEKIVSVRMAPPSSTPTCRPMVVMTGMSALRSAWTPMTRHGARPLARVIQEHIKKPLAEEILFGKLRDGGIVRVLVEHKDGTDGLGFEYLKSDTPIKPRDPEDIEPGDSDPDNGGAGTATLKAKRGGTRRASGPRGQGAKRKSGSSAVPKGPLGSR